MESRTLVSRSILIDTFFSCCVNIRLAPLHPIYKFLDGFHSVFIDSLFDSCSDSQTKILVQDSDMYISIVYVFNYTSVVLNRPAAQETLGFMVVEKNPPRGLIVHSADGCVSRSLCLARALSTSL